MRVVLALLLAGCASAPYSDFAQQVRHDVRYERHDVMQAPDRPEFGCRPTGDCDDRALCAACRLVKSGARPEDIMVVVQGWPVFDRRARDNHMSLEYVGTCILGFRSDARTGMCEHPYADAGMKTIRMPLPTYLEKHGATDICG